jgi:hypothetical protein
MNRKETLFLTLSKDMWFVFVAALNKRVNSPRKGCDSPC